MSPSHTNLGTTKGTEKYYSVDEKFLSLILPKKKKKRLLSTSEMKHLKCPQTDMDRLFICKCFLLNLLPELEPFFK